MQNFLQFIAESEIDPVVRSRIIPAIRHIKTGKVYTGERRMTHWQIRDKADLPLDLNRKMNRADVDRETYGYERGYVDPLKGEFVNDPGFDSIDLIPRSELERKYPGWFKEDLDYDRDVLLSRIVPALMIGKKMYTTERGKTHNDIKHPNRGRYVWGYHDPVANRFYNWTDLKVDATELKPHGGYRPNPRMWEELDRYEKQILHSRVVAAIKFDKDLHIGRPGEDHSQIARRIGKTQEYNKAILSRSKFEGGVRGFYDPVGKQYYPEKKVPDFDSWSLPTYTQAHSRYRQDEGYDAQTMILKSRVIPAGRDQWGNVHLGERGQTHGFIMANLMKKGITRKKGYQGVEYGYHDPLTKKFYNRVDLGFDATELPEFKRRWEETQNEELADYEKTILKSRVIPAARDQWNNLHLGERGKTHGYILANFMKKHSSIMKKKEYEGLEFGWHDPLTKKFYNHDDLDFETTELPEFRKKYEMKEELADYEKTILKSRVIPALKHPVTGKIHLGKRGMDHIDLADSIFEKDPEGLKHYSELEHSGYLDPIGGKFYSRGEAGFDSSELMTGFQRMRKYGTEGYQSFGLFINERVRNQWVVDLERDKNIRGIDRIEKSQSSNQELDTRIRYAYHGSDNPNLAKSGINVHKVGKALAHTVFIGREIFDKWKNAPYRRSFFHTQPKEAAKFGKYLYRIDLKHPNMQHHAFHKNWSYQNELVTRQNIAAGEHIQRIEHPKGIRRYPRTKTRRFKNFKEQFINENALKSRILPALKNSMDSRLLIGKRGQTHQDVFEKHFSGKLWQYSNFTSGFFDPKTKQFLSAYEAGADSEDLDSTDLMTKTQRIRRFGNEETINESSWDKLLYHATYNPKFKPYPGMHVGSLHAAMARAHQVANDAGKNDFGHPLQIHAFRYNTKGKSAPIIDHTDESGSPTAMISHDPHDVGGFLNRKKIAQVKPIGGLGWSHDIIKTALKKKGITHLSYRNSYEDPGSISHMIYDPENLEHVHSFKAPKFSTRFVDTYKPYFDKTAQARKIKEAINEAPVYHVTLTKNVPTIKKKGILPFGGPTHKSNWEKAGDHSRYGEGEIYGFENETDAHKWAANWDWKLHKEMGSGKISVVKINSPDAWEEDTHDPSAQEGKRGRWLKIMKWQKPESITGITTFDQTASRALGEKLRENFPTSVVTASEPEDMEGNELLPPEKKSTEDYKKRKKKWVSLPK